ncbi:MAG: hypothetical protein P8Z40_11010, partial [Chloroflexota bacterium]
MKKNRSLIVVAGILVLALLVVGCAAPATPTEAPTEEPMAEPFRIAVVSPSAINDLAFSQSIYDAVTLIQEEMGGESAVEVAFSDNMFVVEDAAAAIRDYASEGYDLVIA